MKKFVTVSAPGKVILFGEHAVVYGKEAVACAIDKRIWCTVKIIKSSLELRINAKSHGASKPFHQKFEKHLFTDFKHCFHDQRSPNCIETAKLEALNGLVSKEVSTDLEAKLCLLCIYLYLGIILHTFLDSDDGLDIDIDSELPLGAGIGSSASLSVCLSAALLIVCEIIQPIFKDINQANDIPLDLHDADLELINGWAFEGEKLVHGTPSGVDNAIVTYGGAVTFKKGQTDFFPRFPCLDLLLVHSGVARSTHVLVKKVKENYNKLPGVYDAIFNAIGGLVHESKSALKLLVRETEEIAMVPDYKNIFDTITDLVQLNQHLLRAIGVSHESIEAILNILGHFGLTGKLTGAGGGGCVFAIINPDVDETTIKSAMDELSEAGYSSWRVNIGGDGIRCIQYE